MASARPIIVEPLDSTLCTPCTPSLARIPGADDAPARTDSMLTLAYYHLRRQAAALEREGERLGEARSAETVHRMRIATRKLRAALKAFGPLLPEPERTALATELRWLARELAELRDLDVYVENVEAYLRSLPETDRHAAQAHLDDLAASRPLAERRVGAALGSSRYREIVARLAAFTHAAPSPAALRRWGDFRICDGVDAYLKKSLWRVHKRARRARADAPAEAFHRLRIEGKKYRYLLEFFEPLYGKELEKPLKGVRKLHSKLGDYQDACVAEQRLRDYAARAKRTRHAPEEFLALGRLLDAYAARGRAARRAFGKLWRRFEKTEPRFPLAD